LRIFEQFDYKLRINLQQLFKVCKNKSLHTFFL
jgi:hypothetical protein